MLAPPIHQHIPTLSQAEPAETIAAPSPAAKLPAEGDNVEPQAQIRMVGQTQSDDMDEDV